MAVVKTQQTSRLMIKVQTGLSAAGAPVYRTRSFQNVKAAAADADVYAVGQALAGLQKHPLSLIARQDDANLLEQ